MNNDFKVGEMVIIHHLGEKRFGVVTSIELDGLGIMLPSGETVTRAEKECELPPEEIREQLNAAILKAMQRSFLKR